MARLMTPQGRDEAAFEEMRGRHPRPSGIPLRLRLGEGTDAPVTLDTPPIQARLC